MTRRSPWATALALALLLPPLAGCNGTNPGYNPVDARGGDVPDAQGDAHQDGGTPYTPVNVPGCTGACAIRTDCPAALGPTTVTGVVKIPAGTLPVYNARVFIPTGAMPPPPRTGASCDRCDAAPPAVVSAITDINGRFTLSSVPSGQHIPLIISVGKWRRVVTLPEIHDCTATALDPDQARLPRNQAEGNIPRIALSTGKADALECLLRGPKLGLDDAEFTPETGAGRVNLYAGANGADQYVATMNGGASFTKAQMVPAASWWDTPGNWLKYDIVMLSCEGSPAYITYKSQAALASLENYINLGGRVFASHWHNVWISQAQPPQQIQSVATFSAMLMGPDTVTETVDTGPGFLRGQALADWLLLPSVMGSTTRGQLPVRGAKFTVTGIAPSLTQRWVSYQPATGAAQPQYFSFNAPIGTAPGAQCGQMVFTDLHVSAGTGGAGDDSSVAGPPGFPSGCLATSLSAQEKALLFMLFDLTNCLAPVVPG